MNTEINQHVLIFYFALYKLRGWKGPGNIHSLPGKNVQIKVTSPLFNIIIFQFLVLFYLTFYLSIYVNIHFFYPFVLFSSTLLVSPISLLKAKHLDT